jgi:hypothetical protein
VGGGEQLDGGGALAPRRDVDRDAIDRAEPADQRALSPDQTSELAAGSRHGADDAAQRPQRRGHAHPDGDEPQHEPATPRGRHLAGESMVEAHGRAGAAA